MVILVVPDKACYYSAHILQNLNLSIKLGHVNTNSTYINRKQTSKWPKFSLYRLDEIQFSYKLQGLYISLSREQFIWL